MNSNQASRRLFFGLAIPSNTRQQIAKWMAEHLVDLKTVPDKNLHLTLAFYPQINIEQQHQLEELADIIVSSNKKQPNSINPKSIKLCFDKTGHWPNNGILYLKPHAVPATLSDLAGLLRKYGEQHDLYQNPYPFSPHITLSRKAKHLQSIPVLRNPVWAEFSTFSLFESQSSAEGVIYKQLRCWTF